MKHLLLLIILISSINSLYAQRNGYDEIQINSKFTDIKSLPKYQISKDTTNSCWIIKGDSLRIFLTDIDHMELKVDKKDIIKKITAYSKPLRFKDYGAWSNNLAVLTKYIDIDVRKKGSGFYSHVPQDKVVKVWVIKEAETALFSEAYRPDFRASGFITSYKFWWVEDNNGTADITY